MPSAETSAREQYRPALPDATLTRRAITAITGLIAGLAFAVSLGDSARLCLSVGITPWIAWLIGLAVDLSVVGLLLGLRALALAGWPEAETRKPCAVLMICGAVSVALNTAQAWSHQQVGTALVQAVAPCLLIGFVSAVALFAPRAVAFDCFR